MRKLPAWEVFLDKDISDTLENVVDYPEKKEHEAVDETAYQKDIVAKIRNSFQHKLAMYDWTWEELDEIMLHLRETSSDK